MSTKKDTPQNKRANKAKTQQGTDSADPANPAIASEIASVETTHPTISVPLVEIPLEILHSFLERKMDEECYGQAPKSLHYVLHEIPRSMWPNPTPFELARLVAECGWTDDRNGAKRAMELLWQSSYAMYASLNSVARWVKMVKSEAPNELPNEEPNEVSRMAAEIGQDLSKFGDSISHATFMGLFKSGPLKCNGEVIKGDALFDHWIQLPDETNYASPYGFSYIRDDLPNFHAQMKISRTQCEDWSVNRCPFCPDWLILSYMVRDFRIWRTETAKQNMMTGRGNLRVGDKLPDITSPPVDNAPAGKTNQVKKTGNTKKATQKNEINPDQARKINKALDVALESPNLGTGGSRKSQARP